MNKGLTINSHLITESIENHLRYSIGKWDGKPSAYEVFRALGLALRPFIIDGTIATAARHRHANAKRMYYLSMEFLIGQGLSNTLQIWDCMKSAAGLSSRLGVLARIVGGF